MADLNQKLNDLNNTKDVTDQMDEKDIQDNKVMAILHFHNRPLVLIAQHLVEQSTPSSSWG